MLNFWVTRKGHGHATTIEKKPNHMSNAALTPREVDPGWWYRWPRDALDLIRRHPMGFTGVTVLVVLLSFVPQPFISAFVSVFIGGMVMSWARSADHHSGDHFWEILRACVRDTFHLARDIFIYILVIGLIIMVVGHLSQNMGYAMGVIKSTPPNLLWTQIPAWIRSFFETAQADQLVSASPWFLFMLYIALAVGHPGFGLLSHQSITALFKNVPPSVTFMGLGMVPSFIESPVHHWGWGWGVLVAGFCLALVNVVLLVLGYLFAREVFEGQKENVPATVKVPAGVRRAMVSSG
ncbi:hypothetical protein [Acidithiobacillus sp.]|jgi:hypothetical protein|uniref:hypothetical protein n=1 Tax=Acidithiobacillus sp. TaxID=1872118 RepID=UPI002632A073|nr:hypothetical protein [Acidithiobacillus sp.]